MFTGIIKNTGKLTKILKKGKNFLIEVSSNINFKKNEIGSSISCSGACLTLEKYTNKSCRFYLSKETINRTIFKYAKKGEIVNLEKSLKFGDRVSGHFVQGHVDSTCKVSRIFFVGKSWYINFTLNKKYMNLLIEKGSIAINGVSLTISKVFKKGFQVVVIPHTLKQTNLLYLKENNFVNVELDILSKYIKKNL